MRSCSSCICIRSAPGPDPLPPGPDPPLLAARLPPVVAVAVAARGEGSAARDVCGARGGAGTVGYLLASRSVAQGLLAPVAAHGLRCGEGGMCGEGGIALKGNCSQKG